MNGLKLSPLSLVLIVFLLGVVIMQQPVPAQQPPARTDVFWKSSLGAATGPIPLGVDVSTVGPNGNIYIAGQARLGGRTVVLVAQWDGSQWQILGDRLEWTFTGQTSVSSIAVDSNNNVYVGGFFNLAHQNRWRRYSY